MPGAPLLPPHEGIRRAAERLMSSSPVILDAPRRLVVHRVVEEVCEVRRWVVLAVNVRTNHVHVVLSGPCAPEPMMTAFKSWSTRRLQEGGLAPRGQRVWSRHGSTRYLWSPCAVEAACAYVRDQSGEGERRGVVS